MGMGNGKQNGNGQDGKTAKLALGCSEPQLFFFNQL